LAKPLGQPLTDQARYEVCPGAGWDRHNYTHGARRIGLRPCNPRHRWERGNARCQTQKSTPWKVHGVPPDTGRYPNSRAPDRGVGGAENNQQFDYLIPVAKTPDF
jgi:hypothetical protein